MPSFRPAGPADRDAVLPLVQAYYAEERYPSVSGAPARAPTKRVLRNECSRAMVRQRSVGAG